MDTTAMRSTPSGSKEDAFCIHACASWPASLSVIANTRAGFP